MNTLATILARKDLTAAEAESFLAAVLAGEISPEQLAGILCALRMKGETTDEILGFIQAMRKNMQTIDGAADALDVCGTGGDGAGTFNISTAVAFVAAGAGVRVAKHGNRAASSNCGSADVLEALGVTIDLTPAQAQQVFEKTGMVFLFAPRFHPAMKHVAPVRKALGIPTIFNLLGPFANPAGVRTQLMGVPDAQKAAQMAAVAAKLSYKRLLIASSNDGLDEISTAAPSTIFQVEGAAITETTCDPNTYGLAAPSLEGVQGGDAAENAHILTSILTGDQGPPRDIVVLNAAFALYAAGAVDDPKQGVALAQRSIDTGKAKQALTQLIKETSQYA
jgi:anthranilate phosphoribosyltransferase